jgi:hypothetical protein
LASSILTGTGNLTDTGSVVQNPLQFLSRELGEGCGCAVTLTVFAICTLCHASLQFSGKVAVDGGERLGMDARECQLVDDMILDRRLFESDRLSNGTFGGW